MLSVVIKNSILMLLFILIIHFIIINYIADLQQEYKARKEAVIPSVMKPKVVVSTNIEEEQQDPPPKQSTRVLKEESTKQGLQCKDNLKELYDFVYGDENAEEELENLFKEIKPCDFDDNDLVKCLDQDKPGEISLCKNDIDSHHEKKTLSAQVIETRDEEFTKDGHPIIFRYKESQNDLLTGYESFGSSYMLIKN